MIIELIIAGMTFLFNATMTLLLNYDRRRFFIAENGKKFYTKNKIATRRHFNQNMYIFIDESGNLSGSKNEIFVVGGFISNNPIRTARAFRQWQHKHFPKKIRQKSEVKFSDTGLAEKLRLKTFTYFIKQDIRIFYSFLMTENIPLEFRRKRRIESGRLYTELVAKTLDMIFPSAESQVVLNLDHRSLKKVSQKEFKESLRLHILLQLSKKASVYVNTVDSATDPNIQIADWICGALYRYHAKRPFGKKFYEILHSSIIAYDELFKDYWQEFNKKQEKQKTPQKR